MKIDLQKEDLINLVTSVQPSYDLMETSLINPLGRYWNAGGWDWYKHELNELSERKLYDIYQVVKNCHK